MKTFLFVLSALALGATASAQELVTNGGFEANDYGFGGHVVPATITGWKLAIDKNVAGIGKGYLNAPSQEIDLSGVADDNSGVGIYQDLATVAGRKYRLSLDVYTGTDLGHSGGVNVKVGGLGLASDLQGGNTLATGRKGYAFTFTATSDSTRLLLTSAHGNVSHVDNVSVQQAVPEPASMGALAVGAVGLLRRRRSK